jgi:hypothetical protein
METGRHEKCPVQKLLKRKDRMEPPEIEITLSQIKSMASTMATTPVDQRIVTYKSVDPLFLKLEGHLRDRPDTAASLILDEIKLKLIIMAGLEENNEDGDEFLLQQVNSLADELVRILFGRE